MERHKCESKDLKQGVKGIKKWFNFYIRIKETRSSCNKRCKELDILHSDVFKLLSYNTILYTKGKQIRALADIQLHL